MKSFRTTVFLLLLTLALSTFNRYDINATADELKRRLDSVPDVESSECLACAEELYEYWKSKENLTGLTVSYPFIDRINEQAAMLCTCAANKDVYGFARARTLLYDAIDDLCRAERFSVGNLF